MFSTNLENIVFNRHTHCNADELLIITGYIGPDPFANLKSLPLDCHVIYGMYGADSIGEKLHNSLKKNQFIISEYQSFLFTKCCTCQVLFMEKRWGYC